MKLSITPRQSVPPGQYTGVLQSVEQASNKHGDGLRWTWGIVGGQYAGQKAFCTTGLANPTPKNNLGRILAGLGVNIVQQGEIDLSTLGKGKTLLLTITQGQAAETTFPLSQSFPKATQRAMAFVSPSPLLFQYSLSKDYL